MDEPEPGLIEASKLRLAVRTGLLALAACLVLALLLHLLEMSIGAPAILDRGHHTWSYAPTGFRAYHDVLLKLGYKVRRFQRTYASLPAPNESVLLTLDPRLLGMLLSEENWSLGVESPERIRNWLQAGGRLVATLPSRSLGSVAGMDLVVDADVNSFTQELGSGRAAAIYEAVLRGLPELEPRGLPGELRGYDLLEGTRAEIQAFEGPMARSLRPYLGGGVEQAVPLFASAGSATPVLTLSEAPLALRSSSGDGESIAVATALPFSNGALRHTAVLGASVRLADAVSDGGTRWIYFDEHVHGFTDRGGIFRWVTGTALFFPVVTLLLGVLLLGWRGAVRAGPPRPIRATPRRAREELVLSLADMHRRGRHLAHSLAAVRSGYDARIAAHLGTETVPGAQPARERKALVVPADESALLLEGSKLHRDYRARKEALSRAPGAQKKTP